MRFVIDTNVPIVANGKNDTVSPECRLSCIDFLESMIVKGRLILDTDGKVEKEYNAHLNSGQPGVGNRFFQTFLTNAATRIERVELEKENGEYADFPKSKNLKNFDISDRKFVALSRKSGAKIANAVDSDWVDFEDALDAAGVDVLFLCGKDKRKWFKDR